MRTAKRLIFFRNTRQRSQRSNAWSAGRHLKSVSKGGAEKRSAVQKRDYVRHHRPHGISIAQGCRLMGLPRSTYYDAPPVKVDYAEMVTAITAICDEFEAYGYRRVGAELRNQGMVVNSKKIRRLMRKHDLQPKRRRRFVATTDPGPCPAAIRTRQPPKGCIHHFGPRFAVRF
jgi:hypothetical protein